MSLMKEISDALNILTSNGMKKEDITVLHCNTEYPTPMEDVNLNAMLSIRDQLNVKIGYSDHTIGIEVPIAAVAIGAKVIENISHLIKIWRVLIMRRQLNQKSSNKWFNQFDI